MSAAIAHLDLPIQGMTCASCASRIERKLNKLNGVDATVNFATEQATVDYDGKGKALVRLSDGSEAIVGASRIQLG